MRMKTKLFFALFMMSAVCAFGQPSKVSDLRSRVNPRSPETYSDLVKSVFPDAKLQSSTMILKGKPVGIRRYFETKETIPLNSLFGLFQKTVFLADRYDSMNIEKLETLRIRTPQGERLLLILSVGLSRALRSAVQDDESTERKPEPIPTPTPASRNGSDVRGADNLVVLCLFRPGPKIELLDAVEVRKATNDYGQVYFSDLFPHLRVRPGLDGFFIINSSSSNRVDQFEYSFVTVENDRLKLLAENALKLESRSECQIKTDGDATFEIAGAGSKDYRSILVKTTSTTRTFAPDCKKFINGVRASSAYLLNWNSNEQKYNRQAVQSNVTQIAPVKPKSKRGVK